MYYLKLNKLIYWHLEQLRQLVQGFERHVRLPCFDFLVVAVAQPNAIFDIGLFKSLSDSRGLYISADLFEEAAKPHPWNTMALYCRLTRYYSTVYNLRVRDEKLFCT